MPDEDISDLKEKVRRRAFLVRERKIQIKGKDKRLSSLSRN